MEKPDKPKKPPTIRMLRREDGHEADVHPDEVAEWRKSGWELLDGADESATR